MVTGTNHPAILVLEMNGQLRGVRLTQTFPICSRSKLMAELDWLLMDPPEHESLDDLRDLDERIGR